MVSTTIIPKDLNIPYNANVSALLTLQNDLLLTQGKRDGRRITVLGIEENADGTHALQVDENGNVRIAISPNEDGNKDFVEYKTVALRNIETFVQLFMQQVIRNIKSIVGRNSI